MWLGRVLERREGVHLIRSKAEKGDVKRNRRRGEEDCTTERKRTDVKKKKRDNANNGTWAHKLERKNDYY